MFMVKTDWVGGKRKVVVRVLMSANPNEVKKLTRAYSTTSARAENKAIAVNPFGAVHLKIRRLRRFSIVIVTHCFGSYLLLKAILKYESSCQLFFPLNFFFALMGLESSLFQKL